MDHRLKCLETAQAILTDMIARDEATYSEPLTISRAGLALLTEKALLHMATQDTEIDGADVEAMCQALAALWPDVHKRSMN